MSAKMVQYRLQSLPYIEDCPVRRKLQVFFKGRMRVIAKYARQVSMCFLQLQAWMIRSGIIIVVDSIYKQLEYMYPEPSYLDLQQEFFPSVTLYKELIFDNLEDGFHSEIFERLAYDSYSRRLDLTDSINYVIKKEYKQNQQLLIYVCDPSLEEFKFLAEYPCENSITLGQQFLQLDVLIFRIRHIQNQIAQPLLLESAGQAAIEDIEQEIPSAGAEEKSKRRKSIRQVLQVVDQWRKLSIQSHYKMTVQQGAMRMGISKRSLLFYIHNVKMGEKYGFKFQENLENKMNLLTSFVSQKAPPKKDVELEFLNKIKTYYN